MKHAKQCSKSLKAQPHHAISFPIDIQLVQDTSYPIFILFYSYPFFILYLYVVYLYIRTMWAPIPGSSECTNTKTKWNTFVGFIELLFGGMCHDYGATTTNAFLFCSLKHEYGACIFVCVERCIELQRVNFCNFEFALHFVSEILWSCCVRKANTSGELWRDEQDHEHIFCFWCLLPVERWIVRRP